jgi:hypothetical protein
MWKQWCSALSVVLGSAVATGPVQSQGRDPIGSLSKTSTFNSAQHISLGKSRNGKPVCFFREEGSSHRLDIGMTADGAFIRVEHGDGLLAAGSIAKPPLKVFAGKELTKLVDGDLKSTGEYEQFQIYGGAVDYAPNLSTEMGNGFAVIAKGDAKSFFEMVARARGEFVVVQSVSEPRNVDVIAIYKFNASAIPALLSCAQKHAR